MKIDNALSFPERNTDLLNALSLLPSAQEKLSDRAKALIAALPLGELIDLLHWYEMEHAVRALKERVSALQELAKQDLTLSEINSALRKKESG
jgi:hypothetical protein